jgi:hypothetical protein
LGHQHNKDRKLPHLESPLVPLLQTSIFTRSRKHEIPTLSSDSGIFHGSKIWRYSAPAWPRAGRAPPPGSRRLEWNQKRLSRVRAPDPWSMRRLEADGQVAIFGAVRHNFRSSTWEVRHLLAGDKLCLRGLSNSEVGSLDL